MRKIDSWTNVANTYTFTFTYSNMYVPAFLQFIMQWPETNT